MARPAHRQTSRRQLLRGSEFTTHSYAAGEDDVHLLFDWTFRALANGCNTSMTMDHYWQLRDGKVARFRGSEDSALTAQAFAR
jgi:ketosteroid isomerase-like protein